MKVPIIVATGLVLLSLSYKAFYKNEPPEAKSIFSWFFILTILAVLSSVETTEDIANIFTYIIIMIIILNDGYEIISQF